MGVEGMEFQPGQPIEIISCESAQTNVEKIQQDVGNVASDKTGATLRHFGVCNNPECKKIITAE